MANSQRKGKEGELQVSRLLSKATGLSWRRTGYGFKGRDLLGFGLAVEVKNYRGVTVKEIVLQSSRLKGWQTQASKQSGNDTAVLAVKADRQWWFLMEGYTCLGDSVHVHLPGWTMIHASSLEKALKHLTGTPQDK